MMIKFSLSISEGRALRAYLNWHLPKHDAHFFEHSQYIRVILPRVDAQALLDHAKVYSKAPAALQPALISKIQEATHDGTL